MMNGGRMKEGKEAKAESERIRRRGGGGSTGIRRGEEMKDGTRNRDRR